MYKKKDWIFWYHGMCVDASFVAETNNQFYQQVIIIALP
jgi:hypothetical protein